MQVFCIQYHISLSPVAIARPEGKDVCHEFFIIWREFTYNGLFHPPSIIQSSNSNSDLGPTAATTNMLVSITSLV